MRRLAAGAAAWRLAALAADGGGRRRGACRRRPYRAAPPRASERTSVSALHRGAVEEALRAAGISAPRLWEPPASLDGTEPDGAFAADANGDLIVSPELRRAFEYWFAASGEESDERIRARIAAEIHARLHDPARAAALAMLAQFVAYRERGRALADTLPEDADLAARAEAVRHLRRDVFGDADADALFADEEAILTFALNERALANNPNLSDGERTMLHGDAPRRGPGADSRRARRSARAVATGAR